MKHPNCAACTDAEKYPTTYTTNSMVNAIGVLLGVSDPTELCKRHMDLWHKTQEMKKKKV